jgi:hypothetical protein
MRKTAMAIILGLALAACGPTSATTSTLPPATTAPANTSTAGPTTTVAPTTTTTTAATTTTAPAPDVIVNGDVVDSPGRIEVSLGDVVAVRVLADVADEVHVHGYDLTFATERGVPTLVTFTADAPGIFEVELEEAQIPLFELVVTP